MGLGKALKGKNDKQIQKPEQSEIEKGKPVEIAFVLDRSSSMDCYAKEAIKGFNQFVKDQQGQSGEANMGLRQFNEKCSTTYDNVPIADVKKLTGRTFSPSGCTAIYDAVGHTISEVMTRQSNTPQQDRPSHTLVVILTDGDENSSRAYNQHTVQQMVSRAREVFGWEFILIGVGVDAQGIAVKLGIDKRKALEMPADARGMLDSMQTVSDVTTGFRETGVAPLLTGRKGR